MTLLVPHSRPWVGTDQRDGHSDRPDANTETSFRGGLRVELDAAEVLGADKAVLVGADQSCRRTMVTVERTAVETVCDEYASTPSARAPSVPEADPPIRMADSQRKSVMIPEDRSHSDRRSRARARRLTPRDRGV